MKRFRVKTREVWEQDYFVEADSEREAMQKVFEGKGVADDTGRGFSHLLDINPSDVSESPFKEGTLAYDWSIKFDSLDERPDRLHELVFDLEVESASEVVNGSTLSVLQSIVEVLGTTYAEKQFETIYADATAVTPDATN